jgi:hypothetical protein
MKKDHNEWNIYVYMIRKTTTDEIHYRERERGIAEKDRNGWNIYIDIERVGKMTKR